VSGITLADIITVLDKYFGGEMLDAKNARVELEQQQSQVQSTDATTQSGPSGPHAPVTRTAPVRNAHVGNPAST
jgi:hypothetical protein